ncbi:hypothetical protein GGR55DRAFT_663122 [Xylaria sp. FL0064]|nr:hypothetical protein GGR55DRAFT_663122 [Xylaria sp. FL0064]
MSTFHPFPRLPLEIRQQIWDLSVEPHEVAIGELLRRRRRSQPPPLLHACSESRSWIRRKYTKFFESKKSMPACEGQPKRDCPIYSYVNVNIDIVYCSQYALENVATGLPFVRWLIIEVNDPELWYYNYCPTLRHMDRALETVTILQPPSFSEPTLFDSKWWTEWDDWMESCYFTCDPVPFHTRIIWPEFPEAGEINPDNYLKTERDSRRELWGRNPDEFGEVSNDDDERMSAPGRFRLGWRHVPGCNCAYQRSRDG